MAWELSVNGNYFKAENDSSGRVIERPKSGIRIGKVDNTTTEYTFYYNELVLDCALQDIPLTELLQGDGSPWADQAAFESWRDENTGGFDLGSSDGYTFWKYTAQTYSDLTNTVAPTADEGDIAFVYNSTGIPFINRRLKGFYIYESGTWVYGNQELQNEIVTNSAEISTETANRIAGDATVQGNLDTHETTIGNHDDVDLTTNPPINKSHLRYNGTQFVPYKKGYGIEKSSDFTRPLQTTEALVNQQANTYENYLSKVFTPLNTENHKLFGFCVWSMNNTGDDMLIRARLIETVGGAIVKEVVNMRVEPKEVGGAGIVANIIAGGVIIGNVNTGTVQRYYASFEFDLDLNNSTSYTLQLDFACDDINQEATLYEGQIGVEEKEITL